jgi:hypothetical protein
MLRIISPQRHRVTEEVRSQVEEVHDRRFYLCNLASHF